METIYKGFMFVGTKEEYKMKKILAVVILAVVIIFLMIVANIPTSVLATTVNTATITIEPVNTCVGDTFDVKICIKNNPGIIAANLKISFDEELTLIGATNGTVFSSLMYIPPRALSTGNSITESCQFTWSGFDIANTEIKDGIILELQFKASKNVKPGVSHSITVSSVSGDVIDKNLNAVILKDDTTFTVNNHIYSNTCDATCNVCKATRTIKHAYSNNSDTSCNVCKATRTITHTYSNNCDKSCNVCGKTRTVGAHKYSNSCDTTCNYCNAKRTIKHTYSNNCDTSCNVCKATRTITHAYKTTTTKATLTKNGSVVKKCTVCGKVASNTAIKYVKTFKLSTTTYTYDGKVKAPSVTVMDSAGKTLKKNTDYTVTYASGRKNVGTYKVTIKMIGKYSGTKTLTFKINPAKISSYKLSATTYTYDGKVKTPTVTVKNSSGAELTASSYTVTYASGRKNVGTYKVTIKGKGNYTGTKTLLYFVKSN